MTTDEIRDALRAWLLAATDLQDDKIIDAYQTKPRPKPPFIVLYPPLAIQRIGMHDEETLTTTAGVITRIKRRRFPVQVQFFGPDSVNRANDALDGLERYDVRQALCAAGLVPTTAGETTNLTGTLETRYEERAQIEPQFSLTDTDAESVGWIETVSGEATYGEAPPQPFVIE